MAVRRKYKQKSSKYKVKFDTGTVRQWILPLLRRIEAGDYPTKAGRIIGLSRQHTWYYIKKLEKAKLISRQVRSNVVFYELTSQSKNLLTSCEGVVFPGELYRFDKCQVAFGVLREGVVPLEGFRRVEMVNWTALLGCELGVKVRKTTRNWIVHIEVIRGRSPVEVTNLAVNLANRVKDALMSKYGCVLGEGKIVSGELAVEDPVATLFGRYFTVRTPKRKIDHSWTVGELEHLQKDAVIEYLQMPERVKKMEANFDRFMVKFEEMTSALNRLLNPEADTTRVPDGQKRMDTYVS